MAPPNVDCSASGPDPCADASPAIGTICNDGSLYVGKSPDGNVKMYATRCDAGMSWNGSECVGMRMFWPWGTYGLTTNQTSTVTGKTNSAWLAANDIEAWAARYCENLAAYGKSDWFLPAKDELNKIGVSRAVANISSTLDRTGRWYWSSSELNGNNASGGRFSDGSGTSGGKNGAYYVRCVRRD
jgi:hypothetical protein